MGKKDKLTKHKDFGENLGLGCVLSKQRGGLRKAKVAFARWSLSIRDCSLELKNIIGSAYARHSAKLSVVAHARYRRRESMDTVIAVR